MEGDAVCLRLFASTDLHVVEDLEMVGKELDRDHEHGPDRRRTDRRHEVGEVRAHPLAGFMTGWALLMFSVFYWLLDATPAAALRAAVARGSTFFTIYGMNALFIFALSGLVAKMIGFFKLGPVLYAPIKALPLEPQATSLLYALGFNAVMFAVAWFMWRRRWFVKV